MSHFSIYQLRDSEALRYLRFVSYNIAVKHNYQITPDNYQQVYESGEKHFPEQNDLTLLDRLYETFNLNRPKHFTGHSLSVSDVVVIQRDGQSLAAYYCDDISWRSIPDFAQALQRRQQMVEADAAIMQTLAQSETVFRVDDDHLLSLRETDDGYDYTLYHPELRSSVEDSISFTDLSDYQEDFPDDPLFALLTRAICDHFRMNWSATEFTRVDPDHEHHLEKLAEVGAQQTESFASLLKRGITDADAHNNPQREQHKTNEPIL